MIRRRPRPRVSARALRRAYFEHPEYSVRELLAAARA